MDSYEWVRYWAPHDKSPVLGDWGFLSEPTGPLGSVRNPDLVPTMELPDRRFVVLLGESGMGKSLALAGAAPVLERAAEGRGEAFLRLDLREIGGEGSLQTDLLEAQTFVDWCGGTRGLHLLLDSFDECHAHFQNLPARLLSILRTLPLERLRLWIACRAANWPPTLHEGLSEFFQKDVGVYQLAPLCRKDVVLAARARGLNPTAFLDDVFRVDAVPLANRPVTLEFLLRTFAQGGVERSKVVLYGKGCRLLCEETEARRDLGLGGALGHEERLAIAKRLAAVLVLSGKAAVSTSAMSGEGDVAFSDLVGGREPLGVGNIEVTDGSIREVLGSGLFSPLGGGRFVFAHQSYAEFLAASYIADHRVPTDQALRLVLHPGDPSGRCVPQLRDTAAWLASLRPDIAACITEPDVLMRGDLSVFGDAQRASLIRSLLDLSKRRRLLRVPLRYDQLAHPGLADLLRPYLVTGIDFAVVDIVLDIARDCGITELSPDLVALALDGGRDRRLRVAAASVVAKIGDRRSRAALKPLLGLPPAEDPEDELRGCALHACWPDHLTAMEFFAALGPASDPWVVGHFSMFFHSDPISLLAPADIPVALTWAAGIGTSEAHGGRHRQHLVPRILEAAWKHLANPLVRSALAKFVKNRVEIAAPFMTDTAVVTLVRSDASGRRSMLDELVRSGISRADAYVLGRVPYQIVFPEDSTWMLARIKTANEAEQSILATLIVAVADLSDPTVRDAVLDTRESVPALAGETGHLFDPVPRAGPGADGLRERWEFGKSGEDARRAPKKKEEVSLEGVLERALDGAPAYFFGVVVALTHEGEAGLGFHGDIRETSGWRSADSRTRARVLEAAHAFLAGIDPEIEEWLGTSHFPGEAITGCQALLLIALEDRPGYERLDLAIWQRWAPVLFGVAFGEGADLRRDALLRAAPQASSAITTFLTAGAPGFSGLLRQFGDVWTTEVEGLVYEALKRKTMAEPTFPELFDFLLERDAEKAVGVFRTFIAERREPNEPRAVAAAATLLVKRERGIATVLPDLESDRAFAREVLGSVSRDFFTPYDHVLREEQDDADLGGSLHSWRRSSRSQQIPNTGTAPTRRVFVTA